MRNKIVKAYLSEVEKVAWPFDPQDVLRDLNRSPGSEDVARALRRGMGVVDELPHAAQMGRAAWDTAKRVGSAAVRPSTAGPALMRGARNVGKYLDKNPALMRFGVGAALATPILAGAYYSTQQKREEELMNAYRDPGRHVTASLDEFLVKKATLVNTASWADVGSTIRDKGIDSFASGIGAGIGKGVLDAAFGGIGGLYDKLKQTLVTDPRRKQLVESLIRTDPVISDAVSRQPHGKELVLEAYATMVRFAPTISLDPNAARSFLRECVLSGTGPNYATIKNLVETENAAKGRRH